MPCYTSTVMTLAEQYQNMEALKGALEELGYGVVLRGGRLLFSRGSLQGEVIDGRITVRQSAYNRFDEEELKSAYMEKLVQMKARKYAWRTKRVGNKITVERGY